MSEIHRILDQMDRAFSGDAWHGPPLMHLLDGISAEDASKHAVPGAHSVWELVHHVSAWHSIVPPRLQAEVADGAAQRRWQAHPGKLTSPPGSAQSKVVVEAALASDRPLRPCATSARREFGATNVSRYQILHGVVQHSLYHAEQDALCSEKRSDSQLDKSHPSGAAKLPIVFRLPICRTKSHSPPFWQPSSCFGAILALGERGAAPGAAKRDWKSDAGFCSTAQPTRSVSFLRAPLTPPFGRSSVSQKKSSRESPSRSLWPPSRPFCYAAAIALGKQSALVARIIKVHELVSTVPYAIVRNPIYLAMLGMYVASALAVTRWPPALIGLIVFLAGTAIRIRAEENFLRGFPRSIQRLCAPRPCVLPALLFVISPPSIHFHE